MNPHQSGLFLHNSSLGGLEQTINYHSTSNTGLSDSTTVGVYHDNASVKCIPSFYAVTCVCQNNASV